MFLKQKKPGFPGKADEEQKKFTEGDVAVDAKAAIEANETAARIAAAQRKAMQALAERERVAAANKAKALRRKEPKGCWC